MTARRLFWIGIFVLLLLLGIVAYSRRKTIVKYVQGAIDYAQGQIWDISTAVRINGLHPAIQEKAKELINKAEKEGIKLRITSGYRSFPEQEALYAQGRDQPGDIVTYAHAGESAHNYGLAFDVVPVINGKATYEYDWDRIGQIGKSVGFDWGGDWANFKDRPHFEMTFGYSTSQLLELYNSGAISNGFVTI